MDNALMKKAWEAIEKEEGIGVEVKSDITPTLHAHKLMIGKTVVIEKMIDGRGATYYPVNPDVIELALNSVTV